MIAKFIESIKILLIQRACQILNEYKIDYLIEKEEKIGENNLNRRRRQTIQREHQILAIIGEFNGLNGNYSKQEIIDLSFKLGSLGKEPKFPDEE